MKHSVPAVVRAAGCVSHSPCVNCHMFGVEDGADGCGGQEGYERVVAAAEKYLREHPPQPVAIFGTVTGVGDMILFKPESKR